MKLNEDFPQRTDRIIAVIDATTPEAADEAAAALAKALSARADVIRTISRPDGGEFFARNGILFESRRRSAARHGRIDQGAALPRHARRRSDAARRPRRYLAVARGGAAQKDDARGYEAGRDRDRRRSRSRRTGKASRLLLAQADHWAMPPSPRSFGGLSISSRSSITAIFSPEARRRRSSGRRSRSWA